MKNHYPRTNTAVKNVIVSGTSTVAGLATSKTTLKLISIALLQVLVVSSGCTRIVSMTPRSGPAGTAVTLKYEGLWGDPCAQAVKWDGKTISDPFSGTFTVPVDAAPGIHKITLVDKLDSSEAALIFPIFRLRYAWDKFEVTNLPPITEKKTPVKAK